MKSIVLPQCWALLIGSVAANRYTDELSTVANTAALLASGAPTAMMFLYTAEDFSGQFDGSISAAFVADIAHAVANPSDAPAIACDAAFMFDGFAALQAMKDADFVVPDILLQPLWQDRAPPKGLRPAEIGPTLLDINPHFAFFKRWYDGMNGGTPVPVELCSRIVTQIPQETWESGAKEVAEAIAQIEADWLAEQGGLRPESVPELERERLIQHVRKLLQAPKMTALCAEGTAETIDKAIREFTDQTGANCLPTELETLYDLPPLFRRIAEIAKSSDTAEVKVEAMTAQIEALNAKVARLEADLKAAREKTLHGVFRKSAAESLGKTVGSPWFIGAMSLGAAHFFGWTPEDWNFENLRGWAEDLLQATPAPEDAPPRSPVTEA